MRVLETAIAAAREGRTLPFDDGAREQAP
jgi:hypothetical protein